MNMKNSSINDIVIFTDAKDETKSSTFSNTYIFQHNNKDYIVDSSCGNKRASEIFIHCENMESYDILCTHYHNDHSANNGQIIKKDSIIYCHPRFEDKINYLRTNGTGQILVMAREMNLRGMLKRFKMFPSFLITILVSLNKIAFFLPASFMFLVSFLYSKKSIGTIRSGKKNTQFFEYSQMKDLPLNMKIRGWELEPGLYGIETPGHTDCHMAYYWVDKKILFAGDACNFLNGNDIQFGNIESVHETLKILRELVRTEKIDVLAMGHSYPIVGYKKIIDYFDDIIHKHHEIYELTVQVIEKKALNGPMDFDELYKYFVSSESVLLQKIVKIAFPRSTLIFLDVYLYHRLINLGYLKNNKGLWEKL